MYLDVCLRGELLPSNGPASVVADVVTVIYLMYFCGYSPIGRATQNAKEISIKCGPQSI